MSSASKRSNRSSVAELKMGMLEAQAELEKVVLAEQLEEEERAAKWKLEELQAKRKAAERRLAAKHNYDRAHLQYETRSEVGASSASSVASCDARRANSAPGAYDCQNWVKNVNTCIEDSTVYPRHLEDLMTVTGGATIDQTHHNDVIVNQTGLIQHSTPADAPNSALIPESAPFRPRNADFPEDKTYMDSIMHPSQLIKALDCTLASQQELSRRTLLPHMKLERFNGDLTKFSAFRTSFIWNVENNTDDPTRRLTYLYNCLDGLPKSLIENCLHLPPASGYDHAWLLLRKNYENDNDVSEAFIKKLFEWKEIPVGDSEGLYHYAFYLNNVKAALGDKYIRMELRETMKKIIGKLPYQLRVKWIARCEEHEFRLPALIEYIEKEARISKHLHYYECDRRPSRSSTSDKDKGIKGRALPVHVTNPSSVTDNHCSYCERDGHVLKKCYRFEKLNVEDRWSAVVKSKLCFRCLKTGHSHSECKDAVVCGKCGTRSHNTLLHKPPRKLDGDRTTEVGRTTKGSDYSNGATGIGDVTLGKKAEVNDSSIASKPTAVHHVHTTFTGSHPDGRTMLKIVPVLVNESYATYGFIDGGAAPTLVARSLVDKLGLKGKNCNQTMITEAGTFTCKEIVSLHISNISNEEGENVREAFVTEKINVSTDYLMPNEWLSKWPHLQDLELQSLPDHEDHEVELIIGLNTTLNRHIIDQRHGAIDEPSAYLTKLGWVAFGPTGPKLPPDNTPVYHVCRMEETTELLQQNFSRDFWEKEALSVTEDSYEDKRFLDMMSTTVSHQSGKYMACIPFRDASPLPNNREMAMRRIQSLKRKLDNNKGYKELYVAQVEKYIDKAYAETVPVEMLSRADGRVWYMPHHAVRHPTKPKVRVVFDLKAKHAGHSLNDHLLQGPDLTNNLVGVLLRFRQGQHAITADIQEMFHQVKVPQNDRDVLRFLWWPKGDTTKELQDFRMTSHVFGARSSPSTVNYCLRKTVDDFGSKYCEEASSSIYRNFYVDNLLKSLDDEEECIRLMRDLISLCADGGFRLNQWMSSNKRILTAVPEGERDDSVACLDLSKDELPIERALGIHWAMNNDTFTFQTYLQDKPYTRRGVLSVVASLYDPLGFVAPFILLGKQILQEMCRRNLPWDQKMNSEETKRWETWIKQFPRLAEFSISRSFIPSTGFDEVVELQLHHFADASQMGYGVASYLRVVNNKGCVHCTLVMGRARVAPLKRPSIPRLELTAAAVAAQLDCKMRSELDLNLAKSVFWTDSTSVLKYIKNQSARYHTFVNNRVNLIRDLTSISAWRYVPTTMNPADLASRGLEMDKFLQSTMWVSGPEFLQHDEEHWPALPDDVKRGEFDVDAEVKLEVPVYNMNMSEPSFIDQIALRFSSWMKFVRTIAWVKRFCCRTGERRETTLSMTEIKEAKATIWKLVQNQEFKDEITSLSNILAKVKKTSKIIRLRPLMQEGLLRVGGRLDNSSFSEEQKHPIILTSKSPVVKMMVRWTHEQLGHCGQNHLMAELRRTYWITHGNAVVKSVIRSCLVCKRLACKPMTQLMADLPSDRLCPDKPPFTHTGSDCFGPFYTKRGRSTVKRWGAIFTCLTSRAVHIEILDSLDQDSFINAIRRFIARRGPVQRMWSDNGTNLVAAERELRESLQKFDSTKIANALLTKGIDWQFNPPYASHYGGVWERLIRSIRRALSAVCRQQVTTDDTLSTLFCEAEAIINSRPLTKITDDPDCLSPLTPSMLLTLKDSVSPVTTTDKKDLYVRRRWRQAQYLADQFWRRWSREYLPLLQERQKWSVLCRDLKVNDIVLTLDEKLPRGTWPLGRVMEVIRGSDGHVRQAKVKTENGEYRRPIQKLCLLLENETAKVSPL